MVKTVWARLETTAQRQLYLVDADYNFITPVKQYLDYLRVLEKSPNTLYSYCRHLAYYFSFLEYSNLIWQAVTPDDLVSFVQELRNPAPPNNWRPSSPLSERTVNTIVAAVSSFYRYHLQHGQTLTNPVVYEQIADRFSGFKRFLVHTSRGRTNKRSLKLKEPQRQVRIVADADFQRFWHAIDPQNLQFQALVLLLRDGGLRIGEALGLFIQDIEFHNNGIWIKRRSGLANQALAKSMVAGEQRWVDLSPTVMTLLDQLLLTHSFDTDHLFVVLSATAINRKGAHTRGQPLNHAAASALFRHYSQKSGVRIYPHLLRHSHATELIRAGWDASYVQKRLGHAQVQTTLNTYVHLDDAELTRKWRAYQEAIHHA